MVARQIFKDQDRSPFATAGFEKAGGHSKSVRAGWAILRDDSKTTSAFCIYFVLVVVLALVHIEEEDDDEDEQEETPKLFLSGPLVWHAASRREFHGARPPALG